MNPTIVLLAVFTPILVAAFLALGSAGHARLWPVAMLAITAPLEVYRTSSGAGLNASVFRLALLISIIALGWDLIRRRRRLTARVALPFVIYAALLFWEGLSLLFVTSNHSLAYRFLGQYAAGLVAAFVITCYVERRDLLMVVAICSGAAVLPLVAAAYRVFSVHQGGTGDLPGLNELPLNLTIEGARQGGSTLLNGTLRLNSTFADPNQFGYYIATAFLVTAGAVAAIVQARRSMEVSRAIAYVLLALAAGVALAGTYSRSAWLLGVIGLAVLAVLLGRSFWTRRRAMVAGAVLLVTGACASPIIASRISSSEAGNAKSTEVHAHTMHVALRLLVHHPLTGVGLGGYGRYVGEPPIISSSVSTFLTVAAELGLPGLLLLVGAIGVTTTAAVRSVRASPPDERPLLAGIAAAFIALALANTVGEVWMNDFQWVLFGCLLALTTQPMVNLRALVGAGSRVKLKLRREPVADHQHVLT